MLHQSVRVIFLLGVFNTTMPKVEDVIPYRLPEKICWCEHQNQSPLNLKLVIRPLTQNAATQTVQTIQAALLVTAYASHAPQLKEELPMARAVVPTEASVVTEAGSSYPLQPIQPKPEETPFRLPERGAMPIEEASDIFPNTTNCFGGAIHGAEVFRNSFSQLARSVANKTQSVLAKLGEKLHKP